jgi:hypothetical protein
MSVATAPVGSQPRGGSPGACHRGWNVAGGIPSGAVCGMKVHQYKVDCATEGQFCF